MWWFCVFLLLLELQIVEGTVGVQITPCSDSFVEVPLKENLTLNCKPLTQSMEWRFSMGNTSYLLGKLEKSTYVLKNNFGNIFVVSNDDTGISLTINTHNILNVSMVNGTVQCNDLTKSSPSSSNCGLNYVYKPMASNISCQAKEDPNGDELNCTISNFYSSRGIYTCQALREQEDHSEVEGLNTVNMVTSNVGEGPLVSGECHITTKPPETAGNFSYRVKISPGGSEILAKLPGDEKRIEHFGTSTAVPSQAAIYNVFTVWLVAALILL